MMENDVIEAPKGFKTQRFWKDCPVCKGFGTVPAHDRWALDCNGVPTGVPYPTIKGGCTGEITAEPHKSYCGKCQGTGMVLKQ